MLSDEEKREILEDAKSLKRRRDFEEGERRARTFMEKHHGKTTPQEYLSFLKSIQEIFPFPPPSREPTRADKNKL